MVISFLVIIQAMLAYISYLLQVNVVHKDNFIHWYVYIFPFSRLEDFVIGCNLGYLFKNCKQDKKISTMKATVLELLIGLIVLIEWAVYLLPVPILQNNDNWWKLTVLYTLSSCALIYMFALNKGKISYALTNKFFVFIGNVSANGFLIHQMIYRYLDAFERHVIGVSYKIVNILVCLILTVICSFIWDKIYYGIENRSLKRKEI